MPFKSKEDRKKYAREWARLHRQKPGSRNAINAKERERRRTDSEYRKKKSEECKRCAAKPESRKKIRERNRERYQNDPEFRARRLAACKKSKRSVEAKERARAASRDYARRKRSTEEGRELANAAARKHLEKIKSDPAKSAARKRRMRAYTSSDEYKRRFNEQRRKRYAEDEAIRDKIAKEVIKYQRKLKRESIEMQFILNPIMEQLNETGTAESE